MNSRRTERRLAKTKKRLDNKKRVSKKNQENYENDLASKKLAAAKASLAKKKQMKKSAPANNSMKASAASKKAAVKKPAAKKTYSSSTGSYKIKSGDTLSAIAKRNGTTVAAIMKANPSIKNANNIRAGSGLTLPGSSTKKSTKAAPAKKSFNKPDYAKPGYSPKAAKTKPKAKMTPIEKKFKNSLGNATSGYTTISNKAKPKKSSGTSTKSSVPAYAKPGYRGGLSGGQNADWKSSKATKSKGKKATKAKPKSKAKMTAIEKKFKNSLGNATSGYTTVSSKKSKKKCKDGKVCKNW